MSISVRYFLFVISFSGTLNILVAEENCGEFFTVTCRRRISYSICNWLPTVIIGKCCTVYCNELDHTMMCRPVRPPLEHMYPLHGRYAISTISSGSVVPGEPYACSVLRRAPETTPAGLRGRLGGPWLGTVPHAQLVGRKAHDIDRC